MSNGDYLVVGTMYEPQNEESEFYGKYKGGWCDILVVKYDSMGNIKWQKNYGGSGENEDTASLTAVSDDGFFLHGFSYSADFVNNYKGSGDAFVIKCDNDGNIVWQIDVGTKGSDDTSNAILDIGNNKYAALHRIYDSTNGKFTSNIITFDANGKITSNKLLSSVGYVEQMLKANDGGYIILYEDDADNKFIAKIDEDCKIVWKKQISSDKDFFIDVPISLPSGYVVRGGLTNRTPDNYDDGYSLLIKFNNEGEVEYQRKWLYKEGHGYGSGKPLKISENKYIIYINKKDGSDNSDPMLLKITEPLYVFEKPANNSNTYVKEEPSDITFKCDGELELLGKVYINGKELSKEYYTLKKGSTIITIKKEYLSTLNSGDYTLELKYSNGRVAKTSFEVAAKKVETKSEVVKNPNTSDNFVIYATILILSLVGTLKVVHSFKRKCNN